MTLRFSFFEFSGLFLFICSFFFCLWNPPPKMTFLFYRKIRNLRYRTLWRMTVFQNQGSSTCFTSAIRNSRPRAKPHFCCYDVNCGSVPHSQYDFIRAIKWMCKMLSLPWRNDIPVLFVWHHTHTFCAFTCNCRDFKCPFPLLLIFYGLESLEAEILHPENR